MFNFQKQTNWRNESQLNKNSKNKKVQMTSQL